MQADRERIEALQAEVAETLAIYEGCPDSYAATVRLGLLRAMGEMFGALAAADRAEGAAAGGDGEGKKP